MQCEADSEQSLSGRFLITLGNRMLLRDLDYFVSVAESGSFRRAAVQADVTQPAITKAIRRLEAELGVTLLERSRKGTILTDAGTVFVKRAYQLRTNLSEALREAQDMRSRAQGLLRVGVAPSLVESFFRPACSVFLAQRPAARVSLQIALSDELFVGLRRGDLDIVLCSIPKALDPLYAVKPIGFSTLMVVADKSHPILSASEADLGGLEACSWILPRRGVLSRDWVDGVFARHGLAPPTTKVEMDTQTDALLDMVIGSDLLSIAISPMGRGLRSGLASVPFEDLTWHRNVGAMTRAEDAPSPLAQHFLDVVSAGNSEPAGQGLCSDRQSR